MGLKHIEKRGKKVYVTLEIELDETSMLKSEENIESVLNKVGVAAGELALNQFDTTGEKIEINGEVLTSKGVQKKSTKDNMAF